MSLPTRSTATLRLKFNSEKQLTALLCALTPEAKAPVTGRARVKLEKETSILTLKVNADDTVALRATLNAYLWWINSTLKAIETIENA